MLNQPWADKSTTPMVLVHVHRFHQPTNKTTHAIHPNETNCPHTIYPNDINRPTRNPPNETVGAAPVCPPERPHSGVSIPKMHALCARYKRWMRPCGATRAGTQAPPLPISIKPRGVPLPHRIAHSIAPNYAVCHYPIGVVLSIAQGWQV